MSSLHQYSRGWASHTYGIYKQHKTTLQDTINVLYIAIETLCFDRART